jgi:hypothetical protein
LLIAEFELRSSVPPEQGEQAILATVTGNEPALAFRALVMVQAIEYNLAGSARNESGFGRFSLQGDKNRIDTVVATARQESYNIHVAIEPGKIDPSLRTFTVVGWTSVGLNITNPYDLVFHLRSDNQIISRVEAKKAWHEILKVTLKGKDLEKLGDGSEVDP